MHCEASNESCLNQEATNTQRLDVMLASSEISACDLKSTSSPSEDATVSTDGESISSDDQQPEHDVSRSSLASEEGPEPLSEQPRHNSEPLVYVKAKSTGNVPDGSCSPSRPIGRSASMPDFLPGTTRVAKCPPARRAVSFGAVEIREYDMTLGDNPGVSYGPPVMLDWNYEEYESIDIDDYEANREPRRKPRQMLMNYYHRKNILMWTFGHSEEELKRATKEVKKVKQQRSVTRAFLPVSKVEEMMQSAHRKVKRAVKKKSATAA